MALGENLKKLWQTWDVRGFILISLFIQFFLLFCTPLRKRTKNWVVHKSIWLAYLAADWVAAFVVLLILHCPVSPSADEELLVYWTPFLLIHLGGPDTITALSFEDNELWDRHLLQFLGQVFSTTYLFYQSLESNNKLFAPTLLIYLAGIIKYGERIRSLYLASLVKFRDSLLKEDPDARERAQKSLFAVLPVADSSSNTTGSNDEDFSFNTTGNSEERSAEVAFCLFKLFQKTIVDINFTFAQRDRIRDFLLNTSAEESFRIVEMELSMFYDVLYTKILAFHQTVGYILRCVSFFSILISLALWCVTVDKSGLNKIDVKITYTLLIGAPAMGIISLIWLAFSDWNIGYLLLKIDTNDGSFRLIEAFLLYIITRLKYILPSNKETISGMLFRRWSRSIPQYNFYEVTKFATKNRRRRAHLHGTRDYLMLALAYVYELLIIEQKLRYRTPLHNDLMDFIFEELKTKAEHAKGNPEAQGHDLSTSTFKEWTADLEYDDSLFRWHLISEYFLAERSTTGSTNHREYCKVLSRYMLHLIIKQPTLMSSVAGIGGHRFLDAYGKFQQERDPVSIILNAAHRIRSLVDELKKMGDGKWEIMSKVWLEYFLCYSAIECRPRNLIAQMRESGELITYVWALMTHLGLGKHYRKQEVSEDTSTNSESE